MLKREGYHRLNKPWQPSAAQRRVLDGIAAGDSNTQIAARLGLSAETVKWHVSQLLAETEQTDRDELRRWWTAKRGQFSAPAVLMVLKAIAERYFPALAAVGIGSALVVCLFIVSRQHGPAKNASSPLALAPLSVATPTPLPHGFQDVGQFVVHSAGTLQVDNRTAASVVSLSVGDLIQFPSGMHWNPPPGVSVSPTVFLAPSTTLDQETIYVTVAADGGGARFSPVDDHTFRVDQPGAVLITAQDRTGDGHMVDHSVAVDVHGHLKIDPRPVPGNVVTVYTSGQAVDVRGMSMIGHLPPTQASYPSEWFFTWCESDRCGLSYRVRQVIAPVAGQVVCQQGDAFDLVTDSYRLQFRDAGTLNNNPTWSGTPGTCGVDHSVQAGDVITESFEHYLVTAVANDGSPLSLAVSYDGTVYLGHLTESAACPPCRGT